MALFCRGARSLTLKPAKHFEFRDLCLEVCDAAGLLAVHGKERSGVTFYCHSVSRSAGKKEVSGVSTMRSASHLCDVRKALSVFPPFLLVVI